MSTTSSSFGSLPPARQAEVDALRTRAQRYPEVRARLKSDAEACAVLIAHNGFPAATPKAFASARKKYWAAWRWESGDVVLKDQNGKPVRPYRGRGRTPAARRAWAYAVQVWALALLSNEAERFVLDRVEYSARGIKGHRQGARLSATVVSALKARDPELVGLKTQKLVKYRPNVMRTDYGGVLDALDPSAYAVPEVAIVAVDDGGEGASEGRSRWGHLFVDGRPFGAPVTSWVEPGKTADDEADPRGWLRRSDERAGVPWGAGVFGVDEVEPEERKRLEATLKRCAKKALKRLQGEGAQRVAQARRAIVRSRRILRGRATNEERRAHARFLNLVVQGQRAFESEQIAARDSAPKPAFPSRAEADAARAREETAFAVFQRSIAPKPTARSIHEDRKETDEERLEREATVLAAARAEAHEKAPKFLGSNLVGRRTLDDDVVTRQMQLLKEEEELECFRFIDVPNTDIELLEESIRFFEKGIDPDADLNLELALQNVPALREHVREEKRSSKAPRGLIGSLAHARVRQLNLSRFERGVAGLQEALTA